MINDMTYEFVMRQAFNTHRHGANGKADADVYRRFTRAVGLVEHQKEALENNRMPPRLDAVEDLEYDARVQAAKVCLNLRQAIRHVIENEYPSKEDTKELEKIMTSLSEQYDENEIGVLMGKTSVIFKRIGLKMG